MGLRFRQSFTLFPGVRVNLGKNGASVSFGVPGASVNLSGNGLSATVGMPGTGLSYTTRLPLGGSGEEPMVWDQGQQGPATGLDPGSGGGVVPGTRFIQSQGVDRLTSPSMASLKKMMLAVVRQREEIITRTQEATERLAELRREQSWRSMFLLSWIFRARLAELAAAIAAEDEALLECDQWMQASLVGMDFNTPEGLVGPWKSVEDAFDKLSRVSRAWDLTSERDIDRKRERSSAGLAVERSDIRLTRSSTPWVRTKREPLKFQNANGGDLYLYPGFLLVGSERMFALVSLVDLKVAISFTRFTEDSESSIPSDAKVIGETWAKVNKDGSRDKRFAGNYRRPIVSYPELRFSTESGLNEAFMFSNLDATIRFALAFRSLQLRSAGEVEAAAKVWATSELANAKGDTVELTRLLG